MGISDHGNFRSWEFQIMGIWIMGIWIMGIWIMGIWIMGIWIMGIGSWEFGSWEFQIMGVVLYLTVFFVTIIIIMVCIVGKDERCAVSMWLEDDPDRLHPDQHLVMRTRDFLDACKTQRDASVLFVPYCKVTLYSYSDDDKTFRVDKTFCAPPRFSSCLAAISLDNFPQTPQKPGYFSLPQEQRFPWYCYRRHSGKEWLEEYSFSESSWDAMDAAVKKRVDLYSAVNAWASNARKGTPHESLYRLGYRVSLWAREHSVRREDMFCSKEEVFWDRSSFLLLMMVGCHSKEAEVFVRNMEACIVLYKTRVLSPSYSFIAKALEKDGLEIEENTPSEGTHQSSDGTHQSSEGTHQSPDGYFQRYFGSSSLRIKSIPTDYPNVPVKTHQSSDGARWNCPREDLWEGDGSPLIYHKGSSLPLELFCNWSTYQTFVTIGRFTQRYCNYEKQDAIPEKFTEMLINKVSPPPHQLTIKPRQLTVKPRQRRLERTALAGATVEDIEDLGVIAEEFYKNPATDISPCARHLIHKMLHPEQHPNNTERLFLTSHLLQWSIRHDDGDTEDNVFLVEKIYRSLFSTDKFPHYPAQMDLFYTNTDHGRQFAGIFRSFTNKWDSTYKNSLSMKCSTVIEKGMCPFKNMEGGDVVEWAGADPKWEGIRLDSPTTMCEKLQQETNKRHHKGYMCHPSQWIYKR